MSEDCVPCQDKMTPKGKQRRRYFGSAVVLATAGVLGKFVPFTGKAEAVTCYNWVYQYAAAYCDCGCNERRCYWVYRRLCVGSGNSWYEYMYANHISCYSLCGPCGAYVGSC